MSLAEFVRVRRKTLGLTQEELAERAEPMNQTTISLIERGKLLQPSHGYMLRLAHGLGVPVTDLYVAGGFVAAPDLAPETAAPAPRLTHPHHCVASAQSSRAREQAPRRSRRRDRGQ